MKSTGNGSAKQVFRDQLEIKINNIISSRIVFSSGKIALKRSKIYGKSNPVFQARIDERKGDG